MMDTNSKKIVMVVDDSLLICKQIRAALSDTAIFICAVSYTHLDVYKRQVCRTAGRTYQRYRPEARKNRETPGSCRSLPWFGK